MPYLCLPSPPSPELDLAPKAFIASASVSCAFGDKEPKLIPAESNLLIIFSNFSGSLVIFFFECFNFKRSLNIAGGLLSTKDLYS